MRRLRPLLVLATGMVLAVFGFSWIWTGLDIVQVERGWSAVIAGATMLSAGLVIAALSAVLSKLDHIADALEVPRASAPARESLKSGLAMPAPPAPIETQSGEVVSQDRDQSETNGVAPDDKAIVGRHRSGDTTYVMFADGSVEAQTPEGVVTFTSLDALRAYAEEREAAQARA